MPLATVAVLVLASVPGPAAPATSGAWGLPGGPVPSATARRLRAEALLREGGEGLLRVLDEARDGPAASRRAALEALAGLSPEDSPPGLPEAVLGSLLSDDARLREAAARAIRACGPAGREALERCASLVPGACLRGFPAALPLRARDVLHDLRREEVEREFLSIWDPDDGAFTGMFAELRRHGPFGARVLAAIALDRRVAGEAVLGYGPYGWLHLPDGARERSEVRERALQALRDAGDPVVEDLLRSLLRAEPAGELYDENDEDPIPAPLDDAVRETLAALGDPGPLLEMIRASTQAAHGRWARSYEMRRQAGAWAVLADAASDPEERRALFDRVVDLQAGALDIKRRNGFSIDGVEHYNLACALARRDGPGDRERALEELEESVRTYSVSSEWFARDGDLASLHAERRFEAVLRKIRDREKRLREGLPLPGGR